MWAALILAWAMCVRSTDIAYRFVQITDIHMEPFYNPDRGHAKGSVCRRPEAFNKSQCVPFKIEPEALMYPFGRLNCDGPHALIRSLFSHIRREVEEKAEGMPVFGIFTGDLPSHQLSCQRNQAHTMEFVIAHMAAKLKPVLRRIYPAMGNNDYFPNYNISLEPNNPWQEFIASKYARHGLLIGPELETFRRGGYYSTRPHQGLRLLVVNSVAWSVKMLDWNHTAKKSVVMHPEDDWETYRGPNAPLPEADVSGWKWDTDVADKTVMVPCSMRPRDPYGQLAWLRQELTGARSAGERVIIAGHVPPGNKVGDNNFCLQHVHELEEITREYQDLIEVQLYGDHSNDEFRMVWSDGPNAHAVSSVLVSAGVTPRKHCNPSWRLFEVCKHHHVHDFTQFYLPLTRTNLKWETNPEWIQLHLHGEDENLAWRFWKKQYSFREQYGVGLAPSDLEGLWRKMQTSPQLTETYLRNMFSQMVGVEDYFDYFCDMRYLEAEDNARCMQSGRLLPGDRGIWENRSWSGGPRFSFAAEEAEGAFGSAMPGLLKLRPEALAALLALAAALGAAAATLASRLVLSWQRVQSCDDDPAWRFLSAS